MKKNLHKFYIGKFLRKTYLSEYLTNFLYHITYPIHQIISHSFNKNLFFLL